MKYSAFLLFFFLLFISVSCNSEIHRDGTVLYYSESDGTLYLIYQNNDKNHILSADLEPLSTKWEKTISGDMKTPVIKIFDNYIACNCKENMVCILSADNGKTKISFDSDLVFTPDSKGFLVNEGKVFSLCNSSEICAYDIEKSEMLWSYKLETGEKITAEIKIENGFVLYGNSKNKVKALSSKTGELVWQSEELTGLSTIYTFPETVLTDYEKVDGLDLSTGTAKWLSPYEGKVRCILDGTVITQSEEYFSTLYIENGQKIWEYPRNGTTILSCQEEANLAAFTVKNYNNPQLAEDAEYFDKIYIFNVSSGEKVFENNSDLEFKVLNISGFTVDNFYVALEKKQKTEKIQVDKYSTDSFELEKSFVFSIDNPGNEIFVSWLHTDPDYTVIGVSDISNTDDSSYYLFETDSSELIGKMTGFPEIITSTKCYDIITYDEYFNVIEKNLDDFVN